MLIQTGSPPCSPPLSKSGPLPPHPARVPTHATDCQHLMKKVASELPSPPPRPSRVPRHATGWNSSSLSNQAASSLTRVHGHNTGWAQGHVAQHQPSPPRVPLHSHTGCSQDTNRSATPTRESSSVNHVFRSPKVSICRPESFPITPINQQPLPPRKPTQLSPESVTRSHTNHAPCPFPTPIQQEQPHSPLLPPSQRSSHNIKCVLVGDGAVGKTSLLVSYTTNGYPNEYQPTTYDDYNVEVMVNEKRVKLQLCDTAGQEDFDRLRALWYQDADVFLVCFSVVAPASFQNVPQRWVREIRGLRPRAALVLCGTQSDLRNDVQVLIELSRAKEAPVTEHEARRLAHSIKAAAYIECSSLTQTNVKQVFDQCIVSGLDAQSRAGRAVSPLAEVPGEYGVSSPSNRRRRKRDTWRRCFCL